MLDPTVYGDGSPAPAAHIRALAPSTHEDTSVFDQPFGLPSGWCTRTWMSELFNSEFGLEGVVGELLVRRNSRITSSPPPD
jgi:hypothetical protein